MFKPSPLKQQEIESTLATEVEKEEEKCSCNEKLLATDPDCCKEEKKSEIKLVESQKEAEKRDEIYTKKLHNIADDSGMDPSEKQQYINAKENTREKKKNTSGKSTATWDPDKEEISVELPEATLWAGDLKIEDIQEVSDRAASSVDWSEVSIYSLQGHKDNYDSRRAYKDKQSRNAVSKFLQKKWKGIGIEANILGNGIFTLKNADGKQSPQFNIWTSEGGTTEVKGDLEEINKINEWAKNNVSSEDAVDIKNKVGLLGEYDEDTKKTTYPDISYKWRDLNEDEVPEINRIDYGNLHSDATVHNDMDPVLFNTVLDEIKAEFITAASVPEYYGVNIRDFDSLKEGMMGKDLEFQQNIKQKILQAVYDKLYSVRYEDEDGNQIRPTAQSLFTNKKLRSKKDLANAINERSKSGSGIILDEDSYAYIASGANGHSGLYAQVMGELLEKETRYKNVERLGKELNPDFKSSIVNSLREHHDDLGQNRIDLNAHYIDKSKELKKKTKELKGIDNTEESKILQDAIDVLNNDLKFTKNKISELPGDHGASLFMTADANGNLYTEQSLKEQELAAENLKRQMAYNETTGDYAIPGAAKVMQDQSPEELDNYEVLQKFFDLKLMEKQERRVEMQDTYVTLDLSKKHWFSRTTALSRANTDTLRSPKRNDVMSKFIRKNMHLVNEGDGTMKISVADLYDQGFTGRYLDTWFNEMDDVMSEKDQEMMKGFDFAMNANEGEIKALHELVYLNHDVNTYDPTFGTGFVKAVKQYWDPTENVGKEGEEMDPRQMLDAINSVYNEISQFEGNIDPKSGKEFKPVYLTEKQLKNFEKTLLEEYGEGFGGLAPLMVQLGALNIVTGGVMNVVGASRMLHAWRTAMSAKKYGKAGLVNRIRYNASTIALEEGKMQIAGFETGAGLTFGTIGNLTAGFKVTGFAGIAKHGVQGSVSMDVAHVVETKIKEMMKIESFKSEMEKFYGDFDEVQKRLIMNAIMFSTTGVQVIKPIKNKLGNLMPKPDKMNMINVLGAKKQEILDTVKDLKSIKETENLNFLEQPKNWDLLTTEQQAKYIEYSTTQKTLEAMLRQQHEIIDLDISNPKWKENVKNRVIKPLNEGMQQILPGSKPFQEPIYTSERRYFSHKNNAAEFMPDGKVYIDPKMLSNGNVAGKIAHEWNHYAIKEVFAANPTVMANYTKNIAEEFKQFDFRVEGLNERSMKLVDAIEKHYEGGSNLKNEEFLSYIFELMADPVMHKQKVAPSFFKNIITDTKDFYRSILNKPYKPKNAKEMLETIGRFSQGIAKANPKEIKKNVEKVLETYTALGIETIERQNKEAQTEAEGLGSRNLNSEKELLINEQTEMVSTGEYKTPEGKIKFETNKKKITEINKNLERAKTNTEFTDKYKEAKEKEKEVTEDKTTVEKKQKELDAIDKKGLTVDGEKFSTDPKIKEWQYNEVVKKIEEKYKVSTAKSSEALEVLKENNKGILTNYVKDFYKDVPGSNLTKSEFKNYVETVEFGKILETYTKRAESLKDVPFNAYLEGVLRGGKGFGGGRMGNILKYGFGLDMTKISKTVSIDAKGYNEKESAETGGGSFSRETPGGESGVNLIFELPVSQNHIEAVKAKYSKYESRIKDGTLRFKDVKDVASKFTKEMFGKSTEDKALSLAEHWLTAYTTNPLSFNPITATSNRVPGSILGELYGPGRRLKSSDFGKQLDALSPKQRKAADAGLPVQDKLSLPNSVKSSKANKNWYLEKFGIKDNRSSRQIEEYITQRDILREAGDIKGLKELTKSQIGKDKLDISGMDRNIKVTLLPKQIEIIGDGITAQILASHHKDLNRNAAGQVLDRARGEVHGFRAGKPKGLASKVLEGKRFELQTETFKVVQSSEFESILKRNLKLNYTEKEVENGEVIAKTFKEYFEKFPHEGFVENFGINDLKKMSKEINNEFQYGEVTPLKIAAKVANVIEFQGDLKNIERANGAPVIEKNIDLFNNKGDILAGQALAKMNMKFITETFGVGAYEAMMLRGESGNSGIGAFKEIWDMDLGIVDGKHIYGIFRSANLKGKRSEMDAYTMLEQVYAEMGGKEGLKQFEGNSANSHRQGVNKELMKAVLKDGEFNVEKMLNEHAHGEKNKEVLKKTIDNIADLYANKKIDSRQVRQWVEMHSGNMFGLIKKSASLAVLPEGKKAEIEKIYGKEWVLEHTTPAQYAKARIYDYILSGKDLKKKEAMDLTIRDMHTTFIPKKLDAMVNKILQSNLPSNHLPGMDPLFSRYYLANHISDFNIALKNHVTGKVYDTTPGLSIKAKQQYGKVVREANAKFFPEVFKGLASKNLNSENLKHLENIDKAVANSRKKDKEKRGMSAFDFDETLIIKGKNYVYATHPSTGKVLKIDSGDFAVKSKDLYAEGYTMDFKDFANVTGGVEGPLLTTFKERLEKFGPKNVFIVTARPVEANVAIHGWLKSKGIDIPLENITGLANGLPEAKALWMMEKFSEGYNDMYFVDDALPNVKAVREVLNQLDVKSDVQQARASKNLNLEFNTILEQVTGVGAEKQYKAVTAKMEGANKGNWKFIIPPSASDFELLTHYSFSGKGKQGEAHKKFFDDNLSAPFARGINEINRAKQATTNDYMALRKIMPNARKLLNKKVGDTKFTHDAAIRVHRWTEAGYEVPGLSKADLKMLNETVKNNPELLAYSDGLSKISKRPEGWTPPTETWLVENITSDLNNINNKINRSEFLAEWIENKNIIFSEANLNKIEATYGPKHRNALEDMIYRMENGTNRTVGTNALTNQFMNWTNNSVGAIMFFNMRSAGLQTLSSANYLNWAENSPIQAAKAFANQPQYWKDFAKLYNSDMLKQRRSGLKMNVNEAEIAAAVQNSTNKASAALNYLLKKGFTPTQIADSFAIASGGSTYYRNRIKMYEKQGLDSKTAEKRAFTDFQEIAEKTQQSSRPDLISQQQASPLGRLILAFANTPMQYARIMKKSALDISAGRGDTKANVSKILYYGAIQSMIFASLQSGMFSMLFDDEADEDDFDKKSQRVLNTMTDGLLRGFGVGGASVSALKNGILSFMEENEKEYNADYSNVVIDMLNVSPPIGSKARKLKSAGDTYKHNKEVMPKVGFDIDNPAFNASGNVISAITNVPLDRLFTKVQNVKGALDAENANWQRIALMMGYNRWDLNMDRPESVVKAKEEVKEEKKIISKEKAKIKKEENIKEKQKILNETIKEEKVQQEKGELKDPKCSNVGSGGERCKNSVANAGDKCTIHEAVKENKTGEEKQCKGKRTNGKQCGMMTSSKSGYCYYHD